LTAAIGVALVRRSWTLHNLVSFAADTEVAGQSFRVPVAHGRGLSLLSFRPDEARFVELLRGLLQERPGAVLDVGANIGRFLLYVAAIDREIKYFGFDVHSACVSYIDRVIALNGLSESRALAVGLSDHDGIMTLRTGGDDDVAASVIGKFYEQARFDRAYPVCVMQGDTVVGDLATGAISLVKIDVEGGELEVVRGLEHTLRKYRPSIVVEVAPYAHVRDPDVAAFRLNRALALESLLRSLGYRFAKIHDGNQLDGVQTLDPGLSTDIHEMDYLCTPAIS
jgi:FkbM family methyltransferase